MPITEKRRIYLREWQRKQRRLHPERYQKYDQEKKARQKIQCFIHYGGNPPKCARCGFEDLRALSIDHMNNDGAEHRRKLGKGNKNNTYIYNWLRKNNYPEGFQILCMNCQWIKEAERRNTFKQKWYLKDPSFYNTKSMQSHEFQKKPV